MTADDLRPCPFCGRADGLNLKERLAWGYARRHVRIECRCGGCGPAACPDDVDADVSSRDDIPEATRDEMRALARRWWNREGLQAVPEPELAPSPAIERELAAYKRLEPHLMTYADGQYAIFKGDTCHGVERTLDEALALGYKLFGLDAFLVQKIPWVRCRY